MMQLTAYIRFQWHLWPTVDCKTGRKIAASNRLLQCAIVTIHRAPLEGSNIDILGRGTYPSHCIARKAHELPIYRWKLCQYLNVLKKTNASLTECKWMIGVQCPATSRRAMTRCLCVCVETTDRRYYLRWQTNKWTDVCLCTQTHTPRTHKV